MHLDRVRSLIRDVADFPRPGIVFKDLTPVLGEAEAFRSVLDALAASLRNRGFARVVAIESRGFLFGAPLADRLGLPLAPVRKLGKLPYRTHRVDYALEYGVGTLEAHVDAVRAGERVLVVDDLLATGGTALGAAQLVERQGGTVGAFAFVVELGVLNGRDRLAAARAGAPVEALLTL
ncbi:MAG: adenine phosphoribosyltransferase [Myxococcales bacterium]